MVVNRSRPPGTIVPVLIYEDVGKAVEWLCAAFGFTERLHAAEPEGKVSHAQLTIGNGAVMLGAQRVGQGFASPDNARFRPPRPDEVSQYVSVHVDNVDRHYRHAKKFGARILTPPADHPFGERQYTASDLAGHRWTFSQSIANVAPEKWGARTAKAK